MTGLSESTVSVSVDALQPETDYHFGRIHLLPLFTCTIIRLVHGHATNVILKTFNMCVRVRVCMCVHTSLWFSVLCIRPERRAWYFELLQIITNCSQRQFIDSNSYSACLNEVLTRFGVYAGAAYADVTLPAAPMEGLCFTHILFSISYGGINHLL